jgi:hypothetical protein
MTRDRTPGDDTGLVVPAGVVLAGLALTYGGSAVVVVGWAGLLLAALGGVALGYAVVARFHPSASRLARAEVALLFGLAGYVAATAVFAAATAAADFPMHGSVYRAGVVLTVLLVAVPEAIRLLGRAGKDTNTSRPK